MRNANWSMDQKSQFRDCKQIYISMDEIMNISQTEYESGAKFYSTSFDCI